MLTFGLFYVLYSFKTVFGSVFVFAHKKQTPSVQNAVSLWARAMGCVHRWALCPRKFARGLLHDISTVLFYFA